MAIIELNNISKKYQGAATFAVDRVSFSLEKGEVLALVGESGSGKTTLLRLIAGLEHPDSGIIQLDGKIIVSGNKSLPANKRKTGMVFQDYALFPHLTIFENVAFGLKGFNNKEIEKRVYETIELTDLKEDVKKYPHQLSGGQQQRVALARSLAPRPKLLLMDEPFSNLDTILRDQVREEVRQIIKTMGITAILVTHDTKDAFSTADKIAVMLEGKLLQIDKPDTLYNDPNSSYIAELFGKSNNVKATVVPGGFKTPFGFVSAPKNCPLLKETNEQDEVNLFFRAEETDFCDAEEPHLCGMVEKCMYLGDHMQLKVCCNRCNSCVKGDVTEFKEETHSISLKSSVQTWKPGDIVRFKLRNFKVKEMDSKEI
ncbi:MAG TPA: ABC transporter ATP-binding protein [Dysgonamonadaceae bacterium]|nr:ABC transporter ATP-binding protein [Dysgonamonadaceae bacterium]